MSFAPFVTISNNLGIDIEIIVLIIIGASTLIFFAKDFKLGLIMSVVLNSVIFIWFYETGYNYDKPLILVMIYIVLLALSVLSISYSKGRQSVIV